MLCFKGRISIKASYVIGRRMPRTQLNHYCNNDIGRLDIDILAGLFTALNYEICDILKFIPENSDKQTLKIYRYICSIQLFSLHCKKFIGIGCFTYSLQEKTYKQKDVDVIKIVCAYAFVVTSAHTLLSI